MTTYAIKAEATNFTSLVTTTLTMNVYGMMDYT